MLRRPVPTVVIFPIIVNIVCVHAFMQPEGLTVAIPLMIAELIVAYYYRDTYKPLFQA